MAEVILEKVTKIYPGGVVAVKELDLHIRHEEFIVLVGPSGCGKTTTLRMVAGLEDITAGNIYIDNKLVNHLSCVPVIWFFKGNIIHHPENISKKRNL